METAGAGLWVIDAIALCIIGIMALNGRRQGLIAALIGIAGFIFAIWVGGRYASAFAGIISEEVPAAVRFGVAFIIIVLLVTVGVSLLGRLLNRLVSVPFLGALNGIGGAVVGALKGFILVALLAIVLAVLPLSAEWKVSYMDAKVVQASMGVTGAVIDALEPYLSEPLANFIDVFKQYLEELPNEIINSRVRDSVQI